MTTRTSVSSRQFRNMLNLSRELGCQMQPSMENPNVLAGLCPFHEASTLHEAKTLRIDLETVRFWCITCHAAGNSLSFIARVWGMTAMDALDYIKEGGPVTKERPRRDPRYYRPGRDGPAPQNTAVLTMAMHHYARQARQSYTALRFLAMLGVNPDRAIEIGMGYCSGEGLAEYLERRGADEREIRYSPLFQTRTGLEILTGWLTLADQDQSGGAAWICGVRPEESGDGISEARPAMRGIEGRRNRVINLASVERGSRVTVTDDARLYLVMRAEGRTATLITGARTQGNAATLAGRVAETLTRREPRSLIVATHDQELGERIARQAREMREETVVERRRREAIAGQLNPDRRNLRDFTRTRDVHEPGRRNRNGARPGEPEAGHREDPGGNPGQREDGNPGRNRPDHRRRPGGGSRGREPPWRQNRRSRRRSWPKPPRRRNRKSRIRGIRRRRTTRRWA